MSTQVNDNFLIKSPKPGDSRYCKFSGGSSQPYASLADVNSTISKAYRYIGLTVLVNENGVPKEYVYLGGVNDNNLVYKLPDIALRQSKSAHGFTVGMGVYKDSSGIWQRSNANSQAEANVYGVVTGVLDANSFIVGRNGDLFGAPSGLSADSDYYLDITTSGINYTKTPPINGVGKYVKKIFRTNTAGEGKIELEPGYQVASNVFPETKTVSNYAAVSQGATPTFYDVVADETNGGQPTLYFWSGVRMFRLSSTMGSTTTSTTSGTTSGTTSSTSTTSSGTTTTTTAATTTTTTTDSSGLTRRFWLNFSRQIGFTTTEAPTPPWNCTRTDYGNWNNPNQVGKANMITEPGGASTVNAWNGAGMAGVGGIDLTNITADTGVFPNNVISVVASFIHGTTFRLSGLDDSKLYKIFLHFDNQHYESRVVYAACNGKGNTPVGSSPMPGGSPVPRESAGNHGSGQPPGLGSTALDYITGLTSVGGVLDIIFYHQAGGSNYINVTCLILEEYSSGATTTTTAGTTTTTTAATTTTTTTTTAGTTTSTTAATTTTTTTAGGPPTVVKEMLISFLNPYRDGTEYGPGINGINDTSVASGTAGKDNLNDTTGSATTIGLHMLNAGGSGGSRSAPDGGADPSSDSVFGKQYVAGMVWILLEGTQLKLSGLPANRTCKLYFHPNAFAWESCTCNFTANGVTTPNKDNANNQGTAAGDPLLDPALTSCTTVSNGAGEITITAHQVSGDPGINLASLYIQIMSS